VLIPGNHDFGLIDGTNKVVDYSHERDFRGFYIEFYKQHFPELERLHAFELLSGWKLNFVALNSARPRGKDTTMNYGYVGSQRYKPLLETLTQMQEGQISDDPSSSKTLNCVVLHHHLINVAMADPKKEHPISVTLDSAEMLEDFSKANINCVLHGHQHVSFVTSIEPSIIHGAGDWFEHKRRITILGAGSAGVEKERLSDKVRQNSYNIYTPSEQGLKLEIEEYNPGNILISHRVKVLPY
jgi:hypothetical protein